AVATSGSVFRSAGRSRTGASATDPGAASAQVAAAARTITAQTAQAAFAAAARSVSAQASTSTVIAGTSVARWLQQAGEHRLLAGFHLAHQVQQRTLARSANSTPFSSAGRTSSCCTTGVDPAGRTTDASTRSAASASSAAAVGAAAWAVAAKSAEAAFAATARTIAKQTATNSTTADAFASAGWSGHCGVAAAGVTSTALAAKHAAEQIDPEALVTEASAKNQRTNQHVPFHRTTSPYTMNF
ncbi:MAG: hypothetical protein ACK44Z_09735, partial [Pirellulaceae bacterium]